LSPVPDPGMRPITNLLLDWRRGNRAALDQLLPLVYEELRRIAQARLRQEAVGHTIHATALVHEAYVRLGVSHATIERDWAAAKAWLFRRLTPGTLPVR
jgi:DNA-directed RNA polymerase specialized sigma24 family protein